MRRLFVLSWFLSFGSYCGAQEIEEAVRFHASFDRGVDADFATGDRVVYSAETVAREKITRGLPAEGVRHLRQGGKFGGYLAFDKKIEAVVMYQGLNNIELADNAAVTVSFWMKLSPATDLPKGYVDPLQITDKKWNDASIFVDFTPDNPRQFRLGIFSDYRVWNPEDTPWDKMAEDDRPMIPVTQPPFKGESWTHVALTLEDVNAESEGVAMLYLDGKQVGERKGPLEFTWDPQKVAIMIGIYYVGGFDELTIFDRALDDTEIAQLMKRQVGIGARLK
ncbi:MAG: LamG-like jellyroll fold domain-containing protein [Planctomycetota bacterium]|nr:LamG-like jellyroll fold domain-containing protein [Planctomycetota bacterium]